MPIPEYGYLRIGQNYLCFSTIGLLRFIVGSTVPLIMFLVFCYDKIAVLFYLRYTREILATDCSVEILRPLCGHTLMYCLSVLNLITLNLGKGLY